MADLEKLLIRLEGNLQKLDKDFVRGAAVVAKSNKKIEKSVKDMSTKSKKSLIDFKKITEIAIGAAVGQLAVQAFNAAGRAAARFAKSLIVDGVEAAKRQEDAINKLNIALGASGIFSEEASQRQQDFASALQLTTKFGDEQILETQALIQSLGQLDEEGLQQATVAALDLASALSIDLKAATLLVGKAASGEVSSFSRYGLIIQKGADASETFAIALDAINSRFGGAAAAQVATFSGATAQLGNTWGDVTEEIGFAITSNDAVKEAIKELNIFLLEMKDFLIENKDEIKAFVGEGLLFMIDALNAVIGTSGEIQAFFGQTNNNLQKMSARLSEARFKIDAAFQRMAEGAETAGPKIVNVTQEVNNFSDAQIKAAEAGQKLAETLADSDVFAQRLEVLQLSKDEELITEEEFLEQRLILQQDQLDMEEEQLEQARQQNLINQEAFEKAKQALELKGSMERRRIAVAETRFKEQQQAQQFANTKSSLGTISSLQGQSSKELFAIGKAAGIAIATIDGIAAVQKALNTPFPLNIILPPLVAAASAANVAKIASAQPPSFQRGGRVPGTGFGDKTLIAAEPNEEVLDRKTSAKAREFFGGGGDMNAKLDQINSSLVTLIRVMQTMPPPQVTIGEKEVFDTVNRGLETGRRFAAS